MVKKQQKKKKNSKFTTVIYIVATVLFVGVLILAAVLFASNSDSSSSNVANSLYVTYNDVNYSGTVNGFNMDSGEAYRFDVKQYVGVLQGNSLQDFSVSVVVNSTKSNRFYFTVDTSLMQFVSLGDVSAAFVIDKQDDYFTVTAPSGGVLPVLNALYPGKTVSVLDDYQFLSNDYFKLVITSGSESVNVLFDTAIDVTSLSISEEIILI